MATFINLYLGEPTPKIYIKKHLLFSGLWLLNIAVFLLRIDTVVLNKLHVNNDFLSVIIPLTLIVINVVGLLRQKWYYNLAFLFYPILGIFWFIPKMILEKGKIYLFLYYLGSVLTYLSTFKKSLTRSTILIFVVILILTTDVNYVRLIAVIYFSYLFLRILYNYAIGSFKKTDNANKLGVKNGSSISKIDLVDSIEKQKDDEKLTPEENRSKKIERMILWNYFLQYITNNVNSYRGKRAFMIVWFFQYFLYFIITICFFTFFNFQLYKINSNNFYVKYDPNLFDFFYYTIKTVSFSGSDSLKPVSQIARFIEMCSFFILSVYFLIITISSIFSLKMAEYSKDMEIAVDLCRSQNEKIKDHLQNTYDTDISKAVTEIATISAATLKLRSILERIL